MVCGDGCSRCGGRMCRIGYGMGVLEDKLIEKTDGYIYTRRRDGQGRRGASCSSQCSGNLLDQLSPSDQQSDRARETAFNMSANIACICGIDCKYGVEIDAARFDASLRRRWKWRRPRASRFRPKYRTCQITCCKAFRLVLTAPQTGGSR
jgi:hypothetical protein